jgi:hypothetical protein
MNEEYYAKLYARYHGANAYETVEKMYIRIPLYAISNMKLAFLKMKSLRKSVWHDCDRPLAKAIVVFSDVKTPATVCHNSETTWCLLLGNQRLVYPQDNGDIVLTATPHFVKREDLDGFHSFIVTVLGAVSHDGYVYKYNSAVIYLDPFNVIYPGGSYFTCDDENDWFRICTITKKGDPFPDVLHNLVREKYLLITNRLKTKSIETNVSPFLNLWNPQRIAHTTDWISTNLVNLSKCYVKPSFIVQDILDSYGALGKPVGLLIEAPIRVSYVLENIGAPNDERKFYALAVNCTTPEKILYVPKPYDRYNEIGNDFKQNVRWTNVLYDDKHYPGMAPVAWDGNVLGYSYKNTFFCFSHVKLANNFVAKFRNIYKMFEPLSFDVANDSEFFVMHVQNVNGFTVYSVKHRFFKYELHCAKKTCEDETNGRYQKRVELTPLVRNWLNLISNVTLPSEDFPELETLKLVYVLIRHRVCFGLRETEEKGIEETFEDSNSIVFQVDETVKNFINRLRFCDSEKEENKEEGSCVVS